jgi:hypothetical protein
MAMNFGGNWAMLGHGMGAGLGKGINQEVERSLDLLQRKKVADLMTSHGIDEQKAQKKYAKEQLEPLLGNNYSPQALDFLASMPQQQRYAVMSTPGALEQLEQMVSGQLGGGMQQLMQQPQMQQQQAQQQQPQISPMDMLSMINGQQPQNPMGQLQQPQMPQIQPRPGQAMQYQQPMQQMQWISPLQQAIRGGKGPTAAEERNALSREKEVTRQQEKLRTFVNAEESDNKNMKLVGRYAKKMKKILEEHGNEFPGLFVANLDESTLNKFLANPYVREYMDLSKKLAATMVYAKRGQPTNYKLQLEQSSKPGVGKPLETNLNELDDIMSMVAESNMANEYLLSQRDNKGNYPHDIADKLNEYTNVLERPLQNPQFFPVGKHWVDDDGNDFVVTMTKEGKKWKEFHG